MKKYLATAYLMWSSVLASRASGVARSGNPASPVNLGATSVSDESLPKGCHPHNGGMFCAWESPSFSKEYPGVTRSSDPASPVNLGSTGVNNKVLPKGCYSEFGSLTCMWVNPSSSEECPEGASCEPL